MVWSLQVAELGGAGDASPPISGPKFLHFHAVFGKNWPSSLLVPPPLRGFSPLWENPESATCYTKEWNDDSDFL